jgi:hypothetical protein
MLEVAEKLAAASPRIAVFDRKRRVELALKLQQRWQRWELTNFDYLMQVLHPDNGNLVTTPEESSLQAVGLTLQSMQVLPRNADAF